MIAIIDQLSKPWQFKNINILVNTVRLLQILDPTFVGYQWLSGSWNIE